MVTLQLDKACIVQRQLCYEAVAHAIDVIECKERHRQLKLKVARYMTAGVYGHHLRYLLNYTLADRVHMDNRIDGTVYMMASDHATHDEDTCLDHEALMSKSNLEVDSEQTFRHICGISPHQQVRLVIHDSACTPDSVCCDPNQMEDIVECNHRVRLADGNTITIKYKGTWILPLVDVKGCYHEFRLPDTWLLTTSNHNLLSQAALEKHVGMHFCSYMKVLWIPDDSHNNSTHTLPQPKVMIPLDQPSFSTQNIYALYSVPRVSMKEKSPPTHGKCMSCSITGPFTHSECQSVCKSCNTQGVLADEWLDKNIVEAVANAQLHPDGVVMNMMPPLSLNDDLDQIFNNKGVKWSETSLTHDKDLSAEATLTAEKSTAAQNKQQELQRDAQVVTKKKTSFPAKVFNDLRRRVEEALLALETATKMKDSQKTVSEHFTAGAPADAQDLSVHEATRQNLAAEQKSPYTHQRSLSITIQELHERMGHVSVDYLTRLEKALPWLTITNKEGFKCDHCEAAKQVRCSFPGHSHEGGKWTMKHWTEVIDKTSTAYGDTAGPYVRSYIGGKKYAHGWVFPNGFIHVTTAKDKTAGSARLSLERLLGVLPRNTIRSIHTDGGTEFINEEFEALCDGLQINHTYNVPDTPEQNSPPERAWRSLMTLATAMLSASGLPSTFWNFALEYAAHCHNAMVREGQSDTINYQMMGFNPNLRRHWTFGCNCIHWIKPKSNKEKFLNRGRPAIFLGWSVEQNGYLVYDLAEGLTVSHTVKFTPDTFTHVKAFLSKSTEPFIIHWDGDGDGANSEGGTNTNTSKQHTSTLSTQEEIEHHNLHNTGYLKDPMRKDRTSRSNEKTWKGEVAKNLRSMVRESSISALQQCIESGDFESLEAGLLHIAAADATEGEHYRLQRSEEEINTIVDGLANLTIKDPNGLPESPHDIPEPAGNNAFHDATNESNPHHEYWTSATIDEINAHMVNKTWTPCKLPKGKKPIQCKWVYTLKGKRGWREGMQVRFKARLVAKGYHQVWGVDYLDTYAPVMKINSMRTIVSIAAKHNMLLAQSDISTAFVQAPVEEDIYIELPEGCRRQSPNGERLVGKLNKALYGLKQAPRAFNKHLVDWLKNWRGGGDGFKQLETDACVFTYTSGNSVIILGTYVDDLLIACNDKKLLDEFREKSTKQFQITHSEGCDDFVGIQIENTEDYFKLHMTKHIDGLANKFTHITRNEKVHTPLPPNIHFEANAEQADDEDVSLFRSMIGKILYISLMVRLDAAYAVSVLSQYMLNPGKQHFDAIHHLINYLINTKTIGLEYLKNHSHKTCKHPHTLMGMVDASYGGHMHTHKSHTGMVHIATNGIIHYRSMAQ